jgi:acyl-CoA thioester hydrolase
MTGRNAASGAEASAGATQLVHITTTPIRWGDMDAMGHVNNTVYFRYMEQARIDWLSDLGCAPNPEGEGPVIINAHCTFLRQLTYPGDIEIRTFVGPQGRSSFETRHEIRRVDDPGRGAAAGPAKVVWVNFAQQKSLPLSADLRERLKAPSPQAAAVLAGGGAVSAASTTPGFASIPASGPAAGPGNPPGP